MTNDIIVRANPGDSVHDTALEADKLKHYVTTGKVYVEHNGKLYDISILAKEVGKCEIG